MPGAVRDRRLNPLKGPPLVAACRAGSADLSTRRQPNVTIVYVNPHYGTLRDMEMAPAGSVPSVSVGGAAALVERFLAGRTDSTRDAYKRDVEDFATWMGAEPAEAVAQLLASRPGDANALVLDYANQLREAGRSSATINRHLAALRSLVKMARMLGLVSWSIEVSGDKVQRYRDTRGPGLHGVRRLVAHVSDQEGDKAVRDRAIIRLLHDLALRRGEVASLDLEHVDLGAVTVSILGKGRKGRELLTLPPETAAALDDWIDARGGEPGALFINFDRAGKGERLTATSVYRIVRVLGDQAGVRVRPHGLRHSAITTVLDLSHGDLRVAQRFSRHLDVRTLIAYDDNREDLGGKMARMVAAAL